MLKALYITVATQPQYGTTHTFLVGIFTDSVLLAEARSKAETVYRRKQHITTIKNIVLDTYLLGECDG